MLPYQHSWFWSLSALHPAGCQTHACARKHALTHTHFRMGLVQSAFQHSLKVSISFGPSVHKCGKWRGQDKEKDSSRPETLTNVPFLDAFHVGHAISLNRSRNENVQIITHLLTSRVKRIKTLCLNVTACLPWVSKVTYLGQRNLFSVYSAKYPRWNLLSSIKCCQFLNTTACHNSYYQLISNCRLSNAVYFYQLLHVKGEIL